MDYSINITGSYEPEDLGNEPVPPVGENQPGDPDYSVEAHAAFNKAKADRLEELQKLEDHIVEEAKKFVGKLKHVQTARVSGPVNSTDLLS